MVKHGNGFTPNHPLRSLQAMVEWDVDVLPATSYLNRAHKLAPLCGLMFKSSAGHHPLLAGALGAPHALACTLQSAGCSVGLVLQGDRF